MHAFTLSCGRAGRLAAASDIPRRGHLLVCLAACSFLASLPAAARPVIFEETARLTSPDTNYRFEDVAIDGDDLFAVAFARTLYSEGRPRACQDVSDRFQELPSDILLFHYRRQSDGSWQLQGQIASGRSADAAFWRLAVRDGIGAFATGRRDLKILERTSAGWKVTPPPFLSPVSEVVVRDGTIAIGVGSPAVRLLRKNAAGNWVVTATLESGFGFSDDEFLGPDIEFAANQVTTTAVNENFIEQMLVFDRVDDTWQRTAVLDEVFGTVVIDNKIALRLNTWTQPGDILSFYARPQPGAGFTDKYSLITDESFADKRPQDLLFLGISNPHVTIEGSRAFAEASLDDHRGRDAGSMMVFRRATPRLFTHAATLVASDAGVDARLGQNASVSGRRVAAVGCTPFDAAGVRDSAIYVYELPAPLPAVARIQDTFEDRNAAGWTPWGFTDWRVVSSGGTQVFRQANTQGDARAIFEGFEGDNQSIQADLKVNAFAGTTTHWAGLMARYTDAMNFYYLMHGANTLQIRKIVNGVFGPIASTPFTLQVGRKYRFRLEAVGTWLRAYVDDQLMLSVRNTSHSDGRTGLVMWKANAEYDNVVVTSSPYTTLHADSFNGTADENATPPWVTSPANAWARTTTNAGALVFRESVANVLARAVHGAPTRDQIVMADIRPRFFHARGGWAGLVARYVNASTYYYVSLHRSGKASLRRWMNGQITVLDEAAFTVTADVSYRVRLEAIGSYLRLYVNGQLVAEAVDSEIPEGRYGLVTYRAAADFDNFNASRP